MADRNAQQQPLVIIRDAEESDIPAITAIYNDAVENGRAIWNEEVVDPNNRLDWWRARTSQGYPMFVVVDNDPDSEHFQQTVGYATYGDFRSFSGYRHTVEHSVYLRADQRGKGLAVPLMEKLIEHARGIGKHVMVAAIEGENQASIRLHEKLGFQQTGRMPEVGVKFGEWLDLVLMQLILTPGARPE